MLLFMEATPPPQQQGRDVLIKGEGGAGGQVDNKASLCLPLLQHMHTNDACNPWSSVWCMRGMQGGLCVCVCVCTLHLNHTPDYACLFTVRR